jgi:serine protease
VKLGRRGGSVLAVVATAVLASTPSAMARGEDPLAAQQWAVGSAGAAPLDADGQGATVAVIGDGVADHPDLPRIDHVVCVRTGGRPERCRTDVSRPAASRPATLVAGVVAARLGNGEGIAGIAPASGLLDLRVSEAGVARPEDVDAALLRVAELGVEVALVVLPDAVAGSGVGDSGTATRALDAGMLVVGGAGTAGRVLDGDAIAVSALDRDGRLAGTAPTSARWTLAAPGGTGAGDPASAVLGTDADGDYVAMSGTWVAAAHVAAAAAVLRSDGLDAETTAQRLVDTAGASSTAGAPGRLDVGASRRSTARALAPAREPAVAGSGVASSVPVPPPTPTLVFAAPPEIDAPPGVLMYGAGATRDRPPMTAIPESAGSRPAGARLGPLTIAAALTLIALAAAASALVRAARHPIPSSPTMTKETIHA